MKLVKLFKYYEKRLQSFSSPIFLFFKKQTLFLQENELIYFNFKNSKLYLSLIKTKPHSVYFSFSPGIFLKNFNFKKGLKKKKHFKLLSIRFLRKILIILGLTFLEIKVKGLPLNLSYYLKQFYTPIIHAYNNPLNNLTTTESFLKTGSFKTIKISFIKSFSMKGSLKKKGRIKRKVLRKIFYRNSVID